MGCPFDLVVDRCSTLSYKWDALLENFGREDLLPMWVADMDFRPPETVVKAVLDRAAHGIYGYERRPSSFAEAVLNWLKQRQDWEIDPAWLIHTPGVVSGLTLSVLAVTEPGEGVVIQPPVYPPFYRILQANGRVPVENPLVEENGRYVMNLDQLEEIFRSGVKTMLLCSPHNPVGRVWSRAELESLAELILKYDVTVIDDEIWADLVFPGVKHTPLASLSPEIAHRTLTFNAPTKTFNIAGLYVSNGIIPNEAYRERINELLLGLSVGTVGFFGLVAAETAYTTGTKWLDELVAYLEENADYVIRELSRIAPQIKILRPEGTFVLWMDCRELGIPLEDLNQFFVQKAGIALNEGSAFGPVGLGFQRMNIGCPRSLVTEALDRLEKALAAL
jgi:cystathionine beta-lyase